MPMIDYIHLRYSIQIPTKYFNPMSWQEKKTDSGQPYFQRTIRGVKLRYYIDSQTFTIAGKILMLLYDTQVQNVDDIYGARIDLFIAELNTALNKPFPSPVLDVQKFSVTRIDYCFNVETPYVKTYLDFLQKAFSMTNTGRTNFTEEKNLSGSVYIRTNADYRENSNKNYTANFYDKSDRLQYQIKNGQRVTESDILLAQNVLRLEVQCGHQLIKSQLQKHGFENIFGNFLDYRIAYDTISTVYARVFKGTPNADYFTYPAAKTVLRGKQAALNAIFVAASHNIMDKKYYHGRTTAKKAGVYPYCFLDKKSPIPSLKNPMKLILEKLIASGIHFQ